MSETLGGFAGFTPVSNKSDVARPAGRWGGVPLPNQGFPLLFISPNSLLSSPPYDRCWRPFAPLPSLPSWLRQQRAMKVPLVTNAIFIPCGGMNCIAPQSEVRAAANNGTYHGLPRVSCPLPHAVMPRPPLRICHSCKDTAFFRVTHSPP